MIRPRASQGLLTYWRQCSFALRSLAHLVAAVEASRGSRPGVRVAAFAASLTGDLAVSRRSGTPQRSRGIETVVNTLDGAMWAGLVRDHPVSMRPAIVAALLPSSMECGFRLGAGTEALPVVEPAVAWEPILDPTPRWRRIGWLCGNLARELAPPVAAMAAVRRARGLGARTGGATWAFTVAAWGYAGARAREHSQRQAVATWRDRTAGVLAEARLASRRQAELAHNDADVDPKAMLLALDQAGSSAAAAARRALTPDTTTESARRQGATLRVAAEGRPITPAELADRWVSNDMVRRLRSAIDARDDEADALGDVSDSDGIEVVAAEASKLLLRYREALITLEGPRPEMASHLDRTLPVLLIGAFRLAVSARPTLGGAPRPAAAIASGLNILAAARLARRRPEEWRADAVTVSLVVAGTVVVELTSALRAGGRATPGDRGIASPGPGSTHAAVALLTSGWADLPGARVLLALAVLGSWSASFVRREQREPATVVMRLAYFVMPALAAAALSASTRLEAATLDEVLAARLVADVESASREIAEEVTTTFCDALRVVIVELPRYDLGLSDEEVACVTGRYRRELERLAGG